MTVDADKLKRLRIEAGYSQEKLAIMANVNRRTIQRAEAGLPIGLETLSFIADALGVPLPVIRKTDLTVEETTTAEPAEPNDVEEPPPAFGAKNDPSIATPLNGDTAVQPDISQMGHREVDSETIERPAVTTRAKKSQNIFLFVAVLAYGFNTFGMFKQNDFATHVYNQRADDCNDSRNPECLCRAGQAYDRLAPTMLNYLIPLTFSVSDSKERDC